MSAPWVRASPSDGSPRLRGLAIDDEPAVRALMREFLESLGFDADGAASGPEGLSLFERVPYDLVVTDLVMPGMTGWEVVEAVRRRAPAIGVIMVTGSASNLDTDRARELRLPLLPKPVRLDDFRRAVEEALGSRRSAVAEENAGDPLANLRSVSGVVRRVTADLEAFLGAAEGLVRERDELRARLTALEGEQQALREAHEVLLRECRAAAGALGQLRDEHDVTLRTLASARAEGRVLRDERREAVETLEAVMRRLRGGS